MSPWRNFGGLTGLFLAVFLCSAAPAHAETVSCNDNNDCVPMGGACVNNVCQAFPPPNSDGENCTADNDCGGGYCTDNVCQAFPPLDSAGHNCTEDSECAAMGGHCVGGVCTGCTQPGFNCGPGGSTPIVAPVSTPEMSDFMAVAFVVVSGGLIFLLRRKKRQS